MQREDSDLGCLETLTDKEKVVIGAALREYAMACWADVLGLNGKECERPDAVADCAQGVESLARKVLKSVKKVNQDWLKGIGD